MMRDSTRNRRPRTLAIDVIRLVACICPCLHHLLKSCDFIPSPQTAADFYSSPIQGYVEFLLEYGPPLFFMISGSLMLPMKGSPRQFLIKRFKAIGVPMIIWLIIYSIIAIEYNTTNRFLLLLSQLPFFPATIDSFWFLYTLFGLYILTPILSRWIHVCSRREVEFYLFIWLISSLLPYVFHINRLTIDAISPFYYYSGYIGYYLLGYYLFTYQRNITTGGILKLLCAYIMIDGAMPWCEAYLGFPIIGAYFPNFGSILLCSVIYLGLFWICGQRKSIPWVETMSKLTYGVYLINGVMCYIFNPMDIMSAHSPYVQLLVKGSIVISLSFLTIYLLSFIPGSKWFVAYHHERKANK